MDQVIHTGERCFLQFNAAGRLLPGIHECTLDQLRPLVLTNAYRKDMWYRLVSFLVWPVLVPRFSHVYLGGGFLSKSRRPEDLDVILQTKEPYGPEAFAIVERFFLVGLDNVRDIYSIDLHFWMEGAPDGLSDYRSFFQYERPKKKKSLLSPERGIVRISLGNTADMRKQLNRHLSLDPRPSSPTGAFKTHGIRNS